MLIDTRQRSNEPEIMDDFNMEGEILRDALDKIASINRLLGGNKVTTAGLKFLLRGIDPVRPIRILDVGCGNGDMLRSLADYGIKHGYNFQLSGIDANAFTVRHAASLSVSYPNIQYICGDIFHEIKQTDPYDVLLCTLTLHHFKDTEIINLLTDFKAKSNLGIIINDLHRSAIAYYLFMALCFVFKLNQMSRDDGLISILRGFKSEDLRHYSCKLNLTQYHIRWKWAFRYQWIIKTAEEPGI